MSPFRTAFLFHDPPRPIDAAPVPMDLDSGLETAVILVHAPRSARLRRAAYRCRRPRCWRSGPRPRQMAAGTGAGRRSPDKGCLGNGGAVAACVVYSAVRAGSSRSYSFLTTA